LTAREPETLALERDGGIPNSRLPVLIYRGLGLADGPTQVGGVEAVFDEHGWRGAWRNGIFGFHHFHSTAHEVLAIVAGSVQLRLGGPGGPSLQAARGDVLVLPAGTGHRNEGDSGDLLVVGAYPNGMRWDVRRGDPDEYDEVSANIAAVPLPDADPVGGALTQLWR
jgi:uncharacterized protein YjlB